MQDPSVPRQYDRWARVYDLFWRRYLNQTVPVLQDAARIQPGERVLDLACGTGEFERRVIRAVPDAELVGIDLSPTMLHRARHKLEGHAQVSFDNVDAHDLKPYADGHFDAVVSANTFHYFTHPSIVLQEAARVLRPGGRLVILDWCRDFWTCRWMDAVLPYLDPAYQHCYTLDELEAMMSAAPLADPDGFRYRFDLIWGMMVVHAHRPTSPSK